MKGDNMAILENNGILYNTNTTMEQRNVKNAIPSSLEDDFLGIDIQLDESVFEEKKPIPIYNLKADEEARAKLANHEEEQEYETLVAHVKELSAFMQDKDDIDHRAMAVILDDKIMFDEIKRSLKALDFAHAAITNGTNQWEKHEQMLNGILDDIYSESAECKKMYDMLAKLM